MLLRGLDPVLNVRDRLCPESSTVREAFLFWTRKLSPRATECSKKFLRIFCAGFHAGQGNMATWRRHVPDSRC